MINIDLDFAGSNIPDQVAHSPSRDLWTHSEPQAKIENVNRLV